MADKLQIEPEFKPGELRRYLLSGAAALFVFANLVVAGVINGCISQPAFQKRHGDSAGQIEKAYHDSVGRLVPDQPKR